jgi:putative ABC transport system ATP-binding protein
MNSPLIEVKDLTKIYTNEGVETPALRGVNFSVKDGEFVAIMGASGSGKSTLLHILGFLDRHTNGEYRFDGKTIDDYSPEELAAVRNRKFGFVFQAFHLLPRTTVFENIKLPLLYSNFPEREWNERTKEAAESVGLTHRINYESSRLSGGEKQRVAIARALVNNPMVIFADEPTGNLDSKSGKIIMEIIQGLSEKGGRTVILITHETYTAEHAERIIQLHDGQIVGDTAVNHRHAKDYFIK